MKLPMMLRTTTQRGLFAPSAVRIVPTRSATAAALRAVSSNAQASNRPSRLQAQAQFISIRSFSTSQRRPQPTAKYTASPLTDGEYHKLSNHVLDSLTETFEMLLEEADVEALEEGARSKNQGATRGSPASEWDIECAVSILNRSDRHPRRDQHHPKLTPTLFPRPFGPLFPHPHTVRCDEPEVWSPRHLGDQQAAPKQADLALESKEVRIHPSPTVTDCRRLTTSG